jgi:hypothetical protein
VSLGRGDMQGCQSKPRCGLQVGIRILELLNYVQDTEFACEDERCLTHDSCSLSLCTSLYKEPHGIKTILHSGQV